jgi:glycine/serine hydroxymethyltransferase
MRENDIICNMNLLPDEEGSSPTNPMGIRLGVQEMTRFGMGEDEMGRMAAIFADLFKNGADVRPAVHELRASFSTVHYCFDAADQPILPASVTA